jgi:hypothetical protein
MERGFNRCRTNSFNNNIMNIYKTVFDTEKDAKNYLLKIGVLIEVNEKIIFSKNTAAVVYIGGIVNKKETKDPEKPIYNKGFAIDIMSSTKDLDLKEYTVYPLEAYHSFYGYPRNAEAPKNKKIEIKPIKEL